MPLDLAEIKARFIANALEQSGLAVMNDRMTEVYMRGREGDDMKPEVERFASCVAKKCCDIIESSLSQSEAALRIRQLFEPE